jgi:chromosome segregation ATPase
MENSWPYIALSVVWSLVAIAFAALYAREKRTGRNLARLEVEQEYQALREAYEGDMAQLVIAEQDVERLTKERNQAYAQRERMQQELHKADAAIEQFINENEKLKAQVAILVQERGKVGDAPQDPMAENGTQASAKDRPIRNAQKRAGTPRKEH